MGGISVNVTEGSKQRRGSLYWECTLGNTVKDKVRKEIQIYILVSLE